LSPRSDEEESPLARTTARYAALLGTSLTTAEAAIRLGVERSRIRQRLAKGSLYGIRSPKGWRLPAFQFLEDGALPGVGEAVFSLRPYLHPLAVHNFFTLPNVDLYASDLDSDLSPREWLQAGYPPQAVAELAGHLE
ncbi:MAG: DNA-binding protein, partial [bacterium]|nr:DNA-binding protein [bacterium]